MKTYRIEIARSQGRRQFDVTLEERMTVLDALFAIQREQDSTLTFRCACRVGMCGTCAVSINGTPRLACRTRASEVGSRIRLAPLPNLPVIHDLVVSLEPFFAQWKKALPGFRPARESDEPARVPADAAYWRLTADKRDCITCGACFSACGVKRTSDTYLGPAAINRAYLRLVDPRDGAVEPRLKVINDEFDGVWRCHTQFQCTAACPKNISLTDSILRLKRGMLRPRFEKL